MAFQFIVSVFGFIFSVGISLLIFIVILKAINDTKKGKTQQNKKNKTVSIHATDPIRYSSESTTPQPPINKKTNRNFEKSSSKRHKKRNTSSYQHIPDDSVYLSRAAKKNSVEASSLNEKKSENSVKHASLIKQLSQPESFAQAFVLKELLDDPVSKRK